MPVAGLVDAAIAASAGLAARETVLHLDVQLYQAVLTEMQGAAILAPPRRGRAARGAEGNARRFGAGVAEAMVRRTRSTRITGGNPQQLYQRLPDWLADLAVRESLDATIDNDGGSFTATVRREQFTLAAEAWYAQIDELVHGGHRADEAGDARPFGARGTPARARRAARGSCRGSRLSRCRMWRPRRAQPRMRVSSGPRNLRRWSRRGARTRGRGRGAPPPGRGRSDTCNPWRPRLRDQRGAACRRRGRRRRAVASRRRRGCRHPRAFTLRAAAR